jgi:hypothetical protein
MNVGTTEFYPSHIVCDGDVEGLVTHGVSMARTLKGVQEFGMGLIGPMGPIGPIGWEFFAHLLLRFFRKNCSVRG